MTTGNAKYAVNTGITCAQVTIILSTVFTSDKKEFMNNMTFSLKIQIPCSLPLMCNKQVMNNLPLMTYCKSEDENLVLR